MVLVNLFVCVPRFMACLLWWFVRSSHSRAQSNVGVFDLPLLWMGVDIDFKAWDGWTPPLCVAANGHRDAVELVTTSGVDVNEAGVVGTVVPITGFGGSAYSEDGRGADLQ